MASWTGDSFTIIDVPRASGTFASGIEDSGQVVGLFTDASGTHVFLATPSPVPEPLVHSLGLLVSSPSLRCAANARAPGIAYQTNLDTVIRFRGGGSAHIG
jgi:hypothetical protein